MARVNLLQHAGRGGRPRSRDSAGQAEAQQQLFALFLDLQGLQNPRAGLVQRGFDVRQPGVGFGRGAQGRQRGVKLVRQGPLAFQQQGVRRSLVLLQEPVLLQRELVKLVANPLVLLQRFQESHVGWTSRER